MDRERNRNVVGVKVVGPPLQLVDPRLNEHEPLDSSQTTFSLNILHMIRFIPQREMPVTACRVLVRW